MNASVVASLMERANAARQAHKFVDAIALYEVALSREPGNVDALSLCAAAYRASGNGVKAAALLARAATEAPRRADVRFDWGSALVASGRPTEALGVFAEARRLDPDNPEVLVSIGRVQAKGGNLPEAVNAFRAALALKADHRLAAHELGRALVETGAFAEATTVLRRLVADDPSFVEARHDLALLLLRLGDYTAGFEAFEARLALPGNAAPLRTDVEPWDGRPFAGRRLLLHAEQGFGDIVQFLRFVPMARSLGGDVVLQLPRALYRLGRTIAGADRVVTDERDIGPVDCQCPLLSLPGRLRLTLGAVGMTAPYLAADAALAERWASRLKLDAGTPAIGFIWRGNPKSPGDRGRSLAEPAELAPFCDLGGVRLIALQKLASDEIVRADTPSGWRVKAAPFILEHPGPEFDAGLDAFVDSAALMTRLDLIVSVAAAPLHVCGALGRPAIALLKATPDWRWMVDREDSPWYPELRLCRQKPGEDFRPVIRRAVVLARQCLNDRRRKSRLRPEVGPAITPK